MDKVVAVFAGAGGMSLGFCQAGIKPMLAAEIDGYACKTYSAALDQAPLQIDLSDSDAVRSFVRSCGKDEIFAVIGGPPCQGFSTAGTRDQDDPRNRLIFNYLEMVDSLRPRWFLFENVEGMLTSGGGEALACLVKAFLRIGYSLRIEKVNFAAYGLPQARKRVLLIGNRLGIDPVLPSVTHSFNAGKHKESSALPLSPSVSEALAGLGAATPWPAAVPYVGPPQNAFDERMRDGNAAGAVTLHTWSASEAEILRYRHLKPGDTMKDLPEHLWHESFRKRAFRRVMDGMPTEKRGGAPSGLKRLQGQLNSLTITSAATREFVHPTEDRPLSLREAARLQSFPDRIDFAGPDTARMTQIGNAFPPMMAQVLARHLMALDGRFGAFGTLATSRRPKLFGYRLTDAAAMSPALQRSEKLLRAMLEPENQLDLLAV